MQAELRKEAKGTEWRGQPVAAEPGWDCAWGTGQPGRKLDVDPTTLRERGVRRGKNPFAWSMVSEFALLLLLAQLFGDVGSSGPQGRSHADARRSHRGRHSVEWALGGVGVLCQALEVTE